MATLKAYRIATFFGSGLNVRSIDFANEKEAAEFAERNKIESYTILQVNGMPAPKTIDPADLGPIVGGEGDGEPEGGVKED